MDSNEIDKKEKDDPMQSNDMLGRHLSSIGTNNENHSNCVMYGFVCSSWRNRWTGLDLVPTGSMTTARRKHKKKRDELCPEKETESMCAATADNQVFSRQSLCCGWQGAHWLLLPLDWIPSDDGSNSMKKKM